MCPERALWSASQYHNNGRRGWRARACVPAVGGTKEKMALSLPLDSAREKRARLSKTTRPPSFSLSSRRNGIAKNKQSIE